MQEQGFPGEETEAQKATPKGIFVLSYFETDNLKGARLERAKLFRELAHSIADWLPESTLRTASLENLLNVRDAVLKATP